MGHSLDALVFHPQHADLLNLARAVPEANIIMNHTGMPLGYGPYTGKLDEVAKVWRTHLADIAVVAPPFVHVAIRTRRLPAARA